MPENNSLSTKVHEIIEKLSASLTIIENVDCYGTAQLLVESNDLLKAASFLKEDQSALMNMLIDIVAVDYSELKEHHDHRFGVLYHFRSLEKNIRITLKVLLPEEKPEVATLSSLYKCANWLEREAYDQFGIIFTGHTNLRRILNHHQFIGHPLRKDYPITKRQALSVSDDLKEEIDARLKLKGYSA